MNSELDFRRQFYMEHYFNVENKPHIFELVEMLQIPRKTVRSELKVLEEEWKIFQKIVRVNKLREEEMLKVQSDFENIKEKHPILIEKVESYLKILTYNPSYSEINNKTGVSIYFIKKYLKGKDYNPDSHPLKIAERQRESRRQLYLDNYVNVYPSCTMKELSVKIGRSVESIRRDLKYLGYYNLSIVEKE